MDYYRDRKGKMSARLKPIRIYRHNFPDHLHSNVLLSSLYAPQEFI